MKKDFTKWFKKKEWLHELKGRPHFHEGEIWFCAFGLNIGYEEDGSGVEYLRPVLVIRKFSDKVFWGVPLTKTLKQGKYYYTLAAPNERSVAILSQLCLIDAKRLHYKTSVVCLHELTGIRQNLAGLLLRGF